MSHHKFDDETENKRSVRKNKNGTSNCERSYKKKRETEKETEMYNINK